MFFCESSEVFRVTKYVKKYMPLACRTKNPSFQLQDLRRLLQQEKLWLRDLQDLQGGKAKHKPKY